MARFELKDSDYSFNASMDSYLVLKKMGFTEHSMYQEGDIVRVHCPIHKDLVRKSLIVDTVEKTFKCQYANCDAHEGGLLIELVAMYYDCDIRDVSKSLFGEEDRSRDLLFRGEMFINQGRHMEALPYLEQACDLNPRDEITRCKLSALYLELGRKDDAYREYLTAAESYAVRGELDKTLSIYNILIMLQPGAVKARKELAFLFSRMGRPDAAAEQLKWVVDFYMRYNQQKGAQEACEQILEMDTENGMAFYLMGKLMNLTGKRVQAVQNYEQAARHMLRDEEFMRGLEILEEAKQLAPNNNRLSTLEEQFREAMSKVPDDHHSKRQSTNSGDEQEFIDWLTEVDRKLADGEEIPLDQQRLSQASQEHIPVDIPLFAEMEESSTPPGGTSANPNDTAEISPDDRRVAMCLNDMRELDSEQIEAMRQQLIGMFTDVRRSYDGGNLSDWEMRAIKEFYKAFCVAVDVHRRRAAAT